MAQEGKRDSDFEEWCNKRDYIINGIEDKWLKNIPNSIKLSVEYEEKYDRISNCLNEYVDVLVYGGKQSKEEKRKAKKELNGAISELITFVKNKINGIGRIPTPQPPLQLQYKLLEIIQNELLN